MNFLEQLKADTKSIQKKVIYPEVTDKRIVEAVKILKSE
jgi:phosphotransacetylase